MQKIFLSFFSVLLFIHRPPDECGGSYRWDNKIMIDPKGLSLFSKQPTARSIHSIISYQKPPQEELRTNRGTIESKKVTVTGYLIGLGEEDNDQDYHLILASINYKDSLIAEIPDPSCSKLSHFPGLRDKYSIARKFIEDNVDETPGNVHYLDAADVIKVKVTGMLFFDKHAHGNGHSRNDIEIHPVLKIVKAN
jgi:hypothetical protein